MMTVLPKSWIRLTDISPEERTRLRWLIRHAERNGIVSDGVAIRFGKHWFIDSERLPEFLRQQCAKR